MQRLPWCFKCLFIYLCIYSCEHLFSASSQNGSQAPHNDNSGTVLFFQADPLCSSRMQLWMSVCSSTQCVLNICQSGYSTVLVVTWLVPCESAAVLVQVLHMPCSHAPVYWVTLFQATCIGYMYVCLAVTCRQVLHAPYNHAPVYWVTLFKATCIGCMYVCLAVTCHLHFWQNDWIFTVYWGNMRVEQIPK